MKAHAKQPRQDAPENRPPQLRCETTNTKLNSYANAATETTYGCPKTRSSYGEVRPRATQAAQNHPQNTLSQLQRETNKTKLNSYANAAIETASRYETQTFSYDSGRTPICKSLRTRPKPALPQLRRETANPYLNSYDHETGKTATASVLPC